MSGALEAYGGPTEGCVRHKSLRLRHSRGDGRCGCVLADVRARQREILVFLARRTLDADVAVELTAETLALALSSWRRLRELTPE